MRAWCVISTAKIAKNKKDPGIAARFLFFIFFLLHQSRAVSLKKNMTPESPSVVSQCFFRPVLPRFPEPYNFSEDILEPDSPSIIMFPNSCFTFRTMFFPHGPITS